MSSPCRTQIPEPTSCSPCARPSTPSTDWAGTSAKYRDLLAEWKKAGRASRKEDDALWARFRAAQQVFYDARRAKDEAVDAEFAENLKVKEALVAKAEALLPIKDIKAAKKALRPIQDAWEEADIAVPLTVLDSPYRDITRPVINYVRSVRRESPRDLVVVFLPEYIVRHWWEQILHNQTALRLKTVLLFTPGVVVASVPWQLGLPGQRHFHHGVRARTAEGIIDADVAMRRHVDSHLSHLDQHSPARTGAAGAAAGAVRAAPAVDRHTPGGCILRLQSPPGRPAAGCP